MKKKHIPHKSKADYILLLALLYCCNMCSAFSQGIRVWGVGYGALSWCATIELIVAHEVIHVHQKNGFGVQLLAVVRQIEVVFPGQVVDVVRL